MNWLRNIFMKMFHNIIDQFVQEALDKTVKELNEEIDGAFDDERERATLKSVIAMFRSRVSLAVRERL